jgi:hypothetical protein
LEYVEQSKVSTPEKINMSTELEQCVKEDLALKRKQGGQLDLAYLQEKMKETQGICSITGVKLDISRPAK